MDAIEALLEKRDKKAKPHLEQYAPVWLVDQKIISEEESVQFNVVFQHHRHGWISRRYKYDGFNNILYHMGQTILDEEAALEIAEDKPHIETFIADIPNAYGG